MDWKETVKDIIKEVINEKGLYDNAIYLDPNYGDKGQIVSYSICFWEKEYPETKKIYNTFDRNLVVVNIKDPGKKTRPETLRLTTMSLNVTQPEDMEFVDNQVPYWLLPKKSKELREYFKNLIENAYKTYTGKSDMFGCCSKFIECSDVRKCLHENQLYAKACMYRKNLEKGKIFYGINKSE